MQLTDKLEAKREMLKADWECWKKTEERFKPIHEPFLFDLDEDNQDEACQDKRIRQRWNVGPLQHIKEMAMFLYSPSLPPTVWVSHTKNSARGNRIKTRRKRAGKVISCTVGCGKKKSRRRPRTRVQGPTVTLGSLSSTKLTTTALTSLKNNQIY